MKVNLGEVIVFKDYVLVAKEVSENLSYFVVGRIYPDTKKVEVLRRSMSKETILRMLSEEIKKAG